MHKNMRLALAAERIRRHNEVKERESALRKKYQEGRQNAPAPALPIPPEIVQDIIQLAIKKLADRMSDHLFEQFKDMHELPEAVLMAVRNSVKVILRDIENLGNWSPEHQQEVARMIWEHRMDHRDIVIRFNIPALAFQQPVEESAYLGMPGRLGR